MGYTTATALATYVAVSNSSAVAHSNEPGAQFFLVGGYLAIITVAIIIFVHGRYKAWARAQDYRKRMSQLKAQAQAMAAELEANAPNWAAASSLHERATLLYAYVEGNRKRFMELAPGIPLTHAGAATYFLNLQRQQAVVLYNRVG